MIQKKATPVSILFMLEIKKIDEIIKVWKRKPNVKVANEDLENYKIFWKIK